jgi:predicted metal-dependent HD superfamily phosphohydrolase
MKKRRARKKQFLKSFNQLVENILSCYPDDEYYHSQEHIFQMLKFAEIISDETKKICPALSESIQSPEFIYAIVCHDVIYKTGANDNEEKSAEFACEYMKDIFDFDDDYVKMLILSTKEGADLNCIEKKIMHDLDYSRFVSLEDSLIALYKLEREALRDGFTKQQFFVGSLNFYNELLKREKIFETVFFEDYNDEAKNNIKEVIKYLYDNFS